MRRLAAPLAVGVAIGLIFTLSGAASLCWGPRCVKVNTFRARYERHGLEQRRVLQDDAKSYAGVLSALQVLVHAKGVTEVIGVGPDYLTIFNAWKKSSCKPWGTWYPKPCPGHREILLSRQFIRMGVGCVRDASNHLWCVMRLT
jgi:hypothetical protein